VLAGIVGSIARPALRARVADIVWFNERGQWKAGEAAVEAGFERSTRLKKRLAAALSRAFVQRDIALDAELVDCPPNRVGFASLDRQRAAKQLVAT
jgi:hypothetical protein